MTKLIEKIKKFILGIRADLNAWKERNREAKDKFYASAASDLLKNFLDKP